MAPLMRYLTPENAGGRYWVFWRGYDVTDQCCEVFVVLGRWGFVTLYHHPDGHAYCDFDRLSKTHGQVPRYRRWGRITLIEKPTSDPQARPAGF